MVSEYDIDFPIFDWPECKQCGSKMIWTECTNCENGLIPGGNDDDVPCIICDGDAGFWLCPHEGEHTLPMFDEEII